MGFFSLYHHALEFLTSVRAILGESSWAWVVAWVFAGFLKAVRWVKDRYRGLDRLPRRHMVIRLRELREAKLDDPALLGFIDQLERVEVFYAATKVRANIRTILALIHLCEHGFLSPNAVKGMPRFIDADASGVIKIKFSFVDKIGRVLTSLFSGFAMICGLIFWVVYVAQDPVPGFFAGFISFMGFLVPAVLLAGEAGVYLQAETLKKELSQYELPVCQALVRCKKQSSSSPRVSRPREQCCLFQFMFKKICRRSTKS